MKKNNMKSFMLLPMRIVLFLILYCVLSLLTKKNLTELSCWWSVIASAVNIVIIGILLAISKSGNGSYLEMIHYEKGKTKFKTVIGLTLLMIVVGIGGMYLAGYISYGEFPYLAPMMIAPIPLGLAVINLVVLPITTTIAEDGLYLGCGVNQIDSKWTAIMVPAFFYALQHSFIPTIFDWKFIIYRFLSFLPLTIFICCWYYKKRNPLPVMIGHTILNIATASQILLTSANPELYLQMLNK